MQMSDLKILIFPDPKLRKVAKKIDKFDKSLEMLSKNMLKTMYEAEGIGLAATQIDIHNDQPNVNINLGCSKAYTFSLIHCVKHIFGKHF